VSWRATVQDAKALAIRSGAADRNLRR